MRVFEVRCQDGDWTVRQRVDGQFQIVDPQGRERGRYATAALMGQHFAALLSKMPFESTDSLDAALRQRAAEFVVRPPDVIVTTAPNRIAMRRSDG